jgi:predicted site-specific integrase-resolvase
MKDAIVLENREFHSTNRVKHDFGIDHKTLVKWVKIGKLPLPVRLGNRAYYDRGIIESQFLSTAHE